MQLSLKTEYSEGNCRVCGSTVSWIAPYPKSEDQTQEQKLHTARAERNRSDVIQVKDEETAEQKYVVHNDAMTPSKTTLEVN